MAGYNGLRPVQKTSWWVPEGGLAAFLGLPSRLPAFGLLEASLGPIGLRPISDSGMVSRAVLVMRGTSLASGATVGMTKWDHASEGYRRDRQADRLPDRPGA